MQGQVPRDTEEALVVEVAGHLAMRGSAEALVVEVAGHVATLGSLKPRPPAQVAPEANVLCYLHLHRQRLMQDLHRQRLMQGPTAAVSVVVAVVQLS